MSESQHYLIVGCWTGDYDDVFDVEHPQSCPVVEICDDPDGFPITTMGCHVGHLVDSDGIGEYFRHSHDPDRDKFHIDVPPGRHAIEAWAVRHRSYEGPDEYDAGLELTEVAE